MELSFGLFLALVIGFVLLFVLTHLGPLTETQVIDLATKRRRRQIHEYFAFNREEFIVDKEFKKLMNPNGQFYVVHESLFSFPSIAAALLKYKKHEWIIVAFEKNRTINRIWMNKGFDRARVSSYLSVESITKLVKDEQQTSVLVFHNHPNSNPNYYDCRKPSQQDLISAEVLALALNQEGINLLEFVCERGRQHEYCSYPADDFLPLSEFIASVNSANGKTRLTNLSLHLERIL